MARAKTKVRKSSGVAEGAGEEEPPHKKVSNNNKNNNNPLLRFPWNERERERKREREKERERERKYFQNFLFPKGQESVLTSVPPLPIVVEYGRRRLRYRRRRRR